MIEFRNLVLRVVVVIKKHKIFTAAVLCVQSVYLAVTFGSVCALVLV